MDNPRKTFIKLLKVAVSALLIYFVFSKISFVEVWALVRSVHLGWLVLALLAFTASKVISAHRLLVCLHALGYHLTPQSNYRLYLQGMFYNFFIPGGIGGDAYKVYELQKQFQWKLKLLSASIVWERSLGLVAIGVFTGFLGFFVLKESGFSQYWLCLLVVTLVLATSYYVTKRFFPSFMSVYTISLLLSLAGQLLQILSVWCIVLSLGIASDIENYLLVFLVSSALSIFSFAGIGVREWVFLQASKWFDFEPTTAVLYITLGDQNLPC